MANGNKVLVVGATGNVGSGIVPALRARGMDVRALAHDENKAQGLRSQGVDAVVADLERPETLVDAVRGVDKVYLITDNGPQGAQKARNVIDAAKAAGSSPHIVRQSGFGTPKSRIIQQHMEVEDYLKASGLPYTILRPTFFMQNTLMMAAPTVVSDGAFYLPFGDGRLGTVDVRDIVESATAVLSENGLHAGKEYMLTGPQSISFHDVAATLSKTVGKEVSYVNVPSEAARQGMMGMGMHEWTVEGFVELMEGFSQNYADRITTDVQQITGHPPRSFEQFAQDFRQAFGG